MAAEREAVRAALRERAAAARERVVERAAELVRAPSENPPGDTREAAERAARVLGAVAGAEVDIVTAEAPIANVVARIRGARPGRRLVFNGHLDTFPAGDPQAWSVDPFGGLVREGRLYGRGVSDMKGGIACSATAFELLAGLRDAWSGEVVLTLAGDEESMGRLGTGYLLEHVPHAAGDAMICGDAGSPRVLRFGEKGFVWLDLEARGRAAHGAHVHLGENAIERLLEALARLATLHGTDPGVPEDVAAAIEAAAGVSEPLAGSGESRVLRTITCNVGTIRGGVSANLVPDRARAELDIRLPPGITVGEAEQRVAELLEGLEGVEHRFRRTSEPNWTDPGHEIVQLALATSREVLGGSAVVNMRVGASDSRHYRLRGIPTVVCGLTPYNMGGPDEHVHVDELEAVTAIHALTAFDFLSTGSP